MRATTKLSIALVALMGLCFVALGAVYCTYHADEHNPASINVS